MRTENFFCQPSARQAGFTLLEACMVIALLGVLAAAALPNFQRLIETRRLLAAASQLAADIDWVRSAALARHQNLRLSVHVEPSTTCYVLHTGAATDCVCATHQRALCRGDAEAFKTVNFEATDGLRLIANVGSIVFDPMHGTSTPTGTLRVVATTTGREVRQIINIMGRTRSCSPQGAVPGQLAC